MADDKKNVSSYRSSPPPSLPDDSGAWTWSVGRKYELDADFVDSVTRFYRAKAGQSRAFADLLKARVDLARVMAQVNDIGDICRADMLRGRAERAHELAMITLTSQIEQQKLRNILRQLLPERRETTASGEPQSAGFSPADVRAALDAFPELKKDPDFAGAFERTVHAAAEERKKGGR